MQFGCNPYERSLEERAIQHFLQETEDVCRKNGVLDGKVIMMLASGFINCYDPEMSWWEDCGLEKLHAFAYIGDQKSFDEEYHKQLNEAQMSQY